MSDAVPPHPPALRDAPAARRSGGSGAWQVRLLGAIEARRGDLAVGNFGSRGGAALLARLALYPQRRHAREELIELLWPGVELDVGRNRLRQTLFTLRQVLEPPGPMPAPVLLADRAGIGVVPGALECDVVQFEAALRAGDAAHARALYRGELMPGFYDEWIDEERLRLAALLDRLPEGAAASPGVRSGEGPASVDAGAARALPAAPDDAPDIGRSSLPLYLTRFFGRDADGARLRAEVLGHRLVTLLGPGGAGKTRLAVELGAALRDVGAQTEPAARFDFVAFVPLADCASREQLLDALLAALHLRRGDHDPVEPLADALDGRRALLVLDNFEQLCGLGEDVVAQLVGRIASLHVLVTSRRVLGLDGEREFAISPLALPPRGLAARDAALVPALALFADRARAARADFHVSAANVDALVELAHLLDGLPLAIELAAARVRSLAPAAMAALLRDAQAGAAGGTLELLHRGGPRAGFDRRQASMTGVIEWSWRLLEPGQARLLAALTVFHGGFTMQAARAVCGDLGPVELGLDALVAHSLLRMQPAGEDDTPRYAAFEPVREYAARHLAPEDARLRRAAHRRWLTDRAAALPPTPPLAEVRAELPNLLAALRSAVADGAPDDAIRLALPLRRVFEDVDPPADALRLLDDAVRAAVDPALRSQGHTLLGPLLYNAGQRDAARAQADAGLASAPPGAAWRGRALHAAARVRWRIERRPADVLPLIEEGRAFAVAAGDLELQAGLLALRAFVANAQRDSVAGRALHEQALALWERLGNRHAVNSGRYNLAVSAQIAGRQQEALDRLAELETDARALHDWRRLSQSLNVRGNALMALRRWNEAADALRECIRVSWDGLALHELAYGLWNLPRALAHTGRAGDAATLAAFVARFWEARFGALTAADRVDLRRIRRLARCRLDAGALAAAAARGEALPLAAAVALALR